MAEEDLDALLARKASLEVRKLEAEIRHMRRTFFAQIGNTACIALLGVGVLLVFQWPQIRQMELGRIANERIQVGQLLMSAQSIKSDADKATMLQAIAQGWPQYEFAANVARSSTIISRVASGSTTGASQTTHTEQSVINGPNVCKLVDVNIHQLEDSYNTLNANYEVEIHRGRDGRAAGAGPVALALSQQIAEVQDNLNRLTEERKILKC